ncbi:MAG TPA: DUF2085 domain-containing protein [Pyrinomonadaceae bacterium]|jgi:uncharacterized membrane protein|nr:DUF2085 domain-containing protein [Pyrinomonadaceae bacterium]
MFYVAQCGPAAIAARRRALAAWSVGMLCALLLLSLVVAAPWANAHGYSAFASTLYRGFGFVCHQIPARSFQLEGHPFAVCARCTGIYAGFVLGFALYPLVRSWHSAWMPSRVWLFIAAVPITIDFALGFFGIWENTHLSRLLTGAFLGAVCAFFVAPALIDLGRKGWPRFFTTRAEALESVDQESVPLAPSRQAPGDYGSPASRS